MGAQSTSERRLWWRIFGLLVLVCTVWALAAPPMTGPDESSNAIRATAVARGQWTGDPMPEIMEGAPEWANIMVEVQVPESFVDAGFVGACFTGVPRELFFGAYVPQPRGSECPELTESETPVPSATYEYRGQPFYYFLVGLPTLLAVDDLGAFGMRLVGLVLCSALLASALASVLRLRGRSLVMLGAIVALSPQVLYLASTQNPAGLEIAAALCLWATGLVVATSVDEPDRRIVTRLGVTLVVLVLTRGLSPAFAGLALLVLALLARPGRVRHLLGRVDIRAWAGAATAAVAVTALWLFYIHEVFPLDGYPPTAFDKAWDRIPWWTQGMIGVFGSTDVIPPTIVHWAWILGALAVGVLAVTRGSRRYALVALGLVVGGYALLISGEGFGVPQTGFWWQGRYVLPCIVGALLLAPAGVAAARTDAAVVGADNGSGPADDDGEPDDPGVRLLAWPAFASLFVVVQVWCFAYALRHYTVGHDGSTNPVTFLFDPIWSPPLHPALLLVLFVGGVVGLVAVLWRAAFPAGEVARPDDQQSVDYRPPSVIAGRLHGDRPARRLARVRDV